MLWWGREGGSDASWPRALVVPGARVACRAPVEGLAGSSVLITTVSVATLSVVSVTFTLSRSSVSVATIAIDKSGRRGVAGVVRARSPRALTELQLHECWRLVRPVVGPVAQQAAAGALVPAAALRSLRSVGSVVAPGRPAITLAIPARGLATTISAITGASTGFLAITAVGLTGAAVVGALRLRQLGLRLLLRVVNRSSEKPSVRAKPQRDLTRSCPC